MSRDIKWYIGYLTKRSFDPSNRKSWNILKTSEIPTPKSYLFLFLVSSAWNDDLSVNFMNLSSIEQFDVTFDVSVSSLHPKMASFRLDTIINPAIILTFVLRFEIVRKKWFLNFFVSYLNKNVGFCAAVYKRHYDNVINSFNITDLSLMTEIYTKPVMYSYFEFHPYSKIIKLKYWLICNLQYSFIWSQVVSSFVKCGPDHLH